MKVHCLFCFVFCASVPDKRCTVSSFDSIVEDLISIFSFISFSFSFFFYVRGYIFPLNFSEDQQQHPNKKFFYYADLLTELAIHVPALNLKKVKNIDDDASL